MESDTLHSTKNHVLGNLDTEAVEAGDEDVCLLHPLHGLLAQDKQLSTGHGFFIRLEVRHVNVRHPRRSTYTV